jgi:hypothetical protein
LNLDGGSAAHVVVRQALAVDERDEVGGVGPAQHSDEPMALDSVAGEVERMIVELARVLERDSRRGRRFSIPG